MEKAVEVLLGATAGVDGGSSEVEHETVEEEGLGKPWEERKCLFLNFFSI